MRVERVFGLRYEIFVAIWTRAGGREEKEQTANCCGVGFILARLGNRRVTTLRQRAGWLQGYLCVRKVLHECGEDRDNAREVGGAERRLIGHGGKLPSKTQTLACAKIL